MKVKPKMNISGGQNIMRKDGQNIGGMKNDF